MELKTLFNNHFPLFFPRTNGASFIARDNNIERDEDLCQLLFLFSFWTNIIIYLDA